MIAELVDNIGGGMKMILDCEQRLDFDAAVKPLIKFMAKNYHPHMKVVVDFDSTELVEGVARITTDSFIKK